MGAFSAKLSRFIYECNRDGLTAALRFKCLRIREIIWFHSPKWVHVVDLTISAFRFKYNLYFPWTRNRGLRYFPRKILWIDPAEVNVYDTERLFASIYFIQDGDWDRRVKSIESKLQYQVVKGLLGEGIALCDLEQYEHLIEIEKKRGSSAKQAQNAIESKYAQLIQASESIKKDGFKTQQQLGKPSSNRFHTWYDEVRISIGRNGEYILNGSGNHRLAMAKVLKIKKIPVVVIRKHYQFAKSEGNESSKIDH